MVAVFVMHHRWNFPCTVPAGDAQVVRVSKQLGFSSAGTNQIVSPAPFKYYQPQAGRPFGLGDRASGATQM